jgi:hypothetical protein
VRPFDLVPEYRQYDTQRPQEVPLAAVELAAGHALGRGGIRHHLVVRVGVSRRVIDEIARRLALALLGVVAEPLVPPDACERDHPVPFTDNGAVGGDEIGWRLRQQHRLLHELGRERPHELAGQILDPGQRPVARAAEQWRGGRVGTHEARCGGDQLAVDNEVAQRYVVAAEPVAPGAGIACGAEDAQVVQAGDRGRAHGRTGRRSPRGGPGRSRAP